MENNNTTNLIPAEVEPSSKMPRLNAKQKWAVASEFIRKTDAAELAILKLIGSELGDDVSIGRFDSLTAIAINEVLNRNANASSIEDVADMLTHRINNAFALTERLGRFLPGKQLSRIQQVLMAAAKSKTEAKKAFENLASM